MPSTSYELCVHIEFCGYFEGFQFSILFRLPLNTYTDTQNSLVKTEVSAVTTGDTSYVSAKKILLDPANFSWYMTLTIAWVNSFDVFLDHYDKVIVNVVDLVLSKWVCIVGNKHSHLPH